MKLNFIQFNKWLTNWFSTSSDNGVMKGFLQRCKQKDKGSLLLLRILLIFSEVAAVTKLSGDVTILIRI